MNDTQKAIKKLAIMIAVILIALIIYGVFVLINSITNIVDNDEMKLPGTKGVNISKKIKSIDIDVATTNIYINTGETFRVETTNKYIELSTAKEKLYIEEKNHNPQLKQQNKNLTIYIPKNYEFDTVNIESAAGKLKIDELMANNLEIDLAATRFEANMLNIKENTDIEGGAGVIEINNGVFNNMNLELGAGKCTINAKLVGNNKIEANIGKLKLNLLNNDYTLNIKKDLGSITYNNEKVDSGTIGHGDNIINIIGNIGKIEITTEN